MKYKLKISGIHFEVLKKHLFPGDSCEAVAIAVCGRQESQAGVTFLVHEIFTIAYENCSVRTPNKVTWSTSDLPSILQMASRKKLSILKIHSHPCGYSQFSYTDDISDRELFDSVTGWMDEEYPHVSAVMLPGGEIFGRAVTTDLDFVTLERVSVTGNDIFLWGSTQECTEDFSLRTRQAFGEGTVNKLKSMTAAVVG